MVLRHAQHAFVDAFGNPDLEVEKSGASTHYIIVAVIADEPDLASLRSQVDTVRARHFQTGEMKSSKVASNDERRLRVLRDLCEIDGWYFFASSIAKGELSGGFVYKKPFVKALHGDVFRKLYEAYPVLRIFCDEVGTEEFHASFEQYLIRKKMPTLFSTNHIDFVSSTDEVLVQLADFIAGSLARAIDGKVLSDAGRSVLQELQPHSLGINSWPPRSEVAATVASTGDQDALVRSQGLRAATRFREERADTDDFNVRCQIECLNGLLFHYQFVNPRRYVSTQQLMEYIMRAVGEKITRDMFRLQVIAPLRDDGVIVASSSKGYKIPHSVQDLVDFAERGRTVIEPMLARLSIARSTLLRASKGDIDILERSEMRRLRRLVEVFEDETTLSSPSDHLDLSI